MITTRSPTLTLLIFSLFQLFDSVWVKFPLFQKDCSGESILPIVGWPFPLLLSAHLPLIYQCSSPWHLRGAFPKALPMHPKACCSWQTTLTPVLESVLTTHPPTSQEPCALLPWYPASAYENDVGLVTGWLNVGVPELMSLIFVKDPHEQS